MGVNCTSEMRATIEAMPAGSVITIGTFSEGWSRGSITRALSRLCLEGLIARMKKGVYSKTKETRFGKLTSTPLEVMAEEVKRDHSKCFGGLFLFNNLGLTTQVPRVIEILNNKSSYTSKIGSTEIRYVRIRPKINKNNKKYISLLEVLKNSRTIPDSNIQKTYDWIVNELMTFDEKEKRKIVEISFDYPPSVRALLGSIFESKNEVLSSQLRKTLNENSTYKVGTIATFLKNTKKWRLKIEASRK